VWHETLSDPRLYALLARFDADVAEQTRQTGCPACGGRLHRADYPRKARGGPPELGREYEVRASFCCAGRACRRRKTPESLRFLGRRVYLGVVVLLGSALAQGLTPRRVAQLRSRLGVDRRTLRRWRVWWTQTFVATAFWASARGTFLPPVAPADLPGALLERFTHPVPQLRVLQVAVFLAPLSVDSAGCRAGGA
jgi:hypothetical protein